jgi:hypothetical protein
MPIDLSQGLVTIYRDIQGDFVPDLSGHGNTARAGGIPRSAGIGTSTDIPESNVLDLDLRSFVFVFNATNVNNVDVIATVDNDGQVSATDDHKFTDGTDDIPFSISLWIKPSTIVGTQILIARATDVSTSIAWEIFLNDDKLNVYLFGTQLARYISAEFDASSSVTANSWQHIVVTYDGSSTASGIKIYRNRILQTVTTGASTFPLEYVHMNDEDHPTAIGSMRNTSTTFSTSDFRGLMYGVAIWKDRVLSPQEIVTLYFAYRNDPGGEARSGFISRSPRLMIRELDDLPGSYSTVRRTGDVNRTGALSSNFNDQTTIVFSESGSPVFPSMLPRDSSFNSQAVDILGQESDIQISAPIRSFQHPNHLHYSPVEDIGPFDENRSIPATSFYLSGTSFDVLPGFLSPLRSKMMIDIDITPQSEVTLTRNVESRNVGESQPVSPNNTGFYYYNFSRKEWEQIGLQDPATGAALHYDFAIDTIAANTSGTFPNQFTFGNCSAKERDDTASAGDVRLELGYSKIGSPTVVMSAPAATKYHATSSQSIKLSGLISSPFMLEAVKVEFGNVKAQRINGGAVASSSPLVFKKGSIRDIDNYVFFMYRQSRANRVVDSLADVSSSNRFLICSASMTFWNSASLSGSSWSPATLLHSPAFSYEFGLPYDSNFVVGEFTGSVTLNTKPAICGAQNLGVSRVPEVDGVGTNFIQNSWCGGSSVESVQIFGDGSNFVKPFDFAAGETLRKVIERGAKVDHRSFRKFGGEASDTSSETLAGFGTVSLSAPQSDDSPYILLPEDELIFGLEAGVPQLPFAALVSNLTGSHLRIGTEPCRVTLIGSLIKDSVEYSPSINQDLSSNSIHEMIGAEPALDQFQIEPISSYYGSYIDDIVTGSMLTPLNSAATIFTIYGQDESRRVMGRASQGQASTSGSFQRFTTAFDTGERTYDSCLPNLISMINVSPVATPYSYNGDNVPGFVVPSAVGTYWFTEENLASSPITQFPFKNNPDRIATTPIGVLSASESGDYAGFNIASSPPRVTGAGLDSLIELFKVRGTQFFRAPSDNLYDITSPPYYITGSLERAGDIDPIDLTDNLVCHYRAGFTTASPPITALVNRVTNPGSNTDLEGVKGTSTGDGPTRVPGSPVFPDTPGLYNGKGYSVLFADAGATAGNVEMLVASGDADDHKMSSGGSDASFSISVTFYLSDVSTSSQFLVCRRRGNSAGDQNFEYSIHVSNAGRVVFRKGRSNPNVESYLQAVTDAGTIVANTWYNVLVTFKAPDVDAAFATAYKIYVNGVNQSCTFTDGGSSASDTTTSVFSRLRIGADIDPATGDGSASPFTPYSAPDPDPTTEIRDGYIHSVAIWKDRVITSKMAAELFNLEILGSAIGYLRHRQGSNVLGIARSQALRYGISNINSEFTSVRLRSDRFGHQRDLLEPRRSSATAGGAPPIRISFSGSGGTEAADTHSQNLSAFATSSMPYFDDGVARNRGDNPDVDFLVEILT